MKVFNDQLNELLIFWQCELEDSIGEGYHEHSTAVEECKRYISIIKNAIKELNKYEEQPVNINIPKMFESLATLDGFSVSRTVGSRMYE